MSAIMLQEIKSLQCLVRGFFITIWMHSDAAQVIFLIVASVNHLAAVLVPAKYAKVKNIAHIYLISFVHFWKFILEILIEISSENWTDFKGLGYYSVSQSFRYELTLSF